ncbi:MAG TPA: HAD family hydrolase [Solirubrobacteraceae bacterium]
MKRALLLDLDDTLVVEEPAAVAAFAATAGAAAEGHPLDPRQLALGARACARELWHGAEVCAFGRRIGISSWEALWCRYEGDGEELRAMRAWAPGFRRDTWRAALERQGVQDDDLAAELGERFGEERRARHETFEDAAPVLDALRGDYRLALVTNGASCLQREKFEASGLGDRFDAVVVSGDLRSAKPDPSVYAHALSALGAEPGDAVMVGDSLRNDVDGPIAAGLSGIWLNRTGEPRPADRDDLVEIADLHALAGKLAGLA